MDFKTYIKNVVNENKKEQYIINEAKTYGLFDNLFKSSNKEAKKFLISFGSLFSLFTGEATKTELALQKVCQDRKKDAQKRLDNIKKAKDKAKAAQIKAKYALEKNQADIRATRKIEAFNALEKKYKRMETFYKGNIFEYGPEEIAMIDKQFEDSFKALTSGGDLEAAEKIKAYKDVLMIKEDGTIRTKEELAKFVKSEDGKNILGKLQGYNDVDEKLANYTKENAETIWNELSQMEEYTPPMDIKEANKQLENVDKQISTIEEQIKNAEKIESFNNEINGYQKSIEASDKKSKEILKGENDKYSLSDSFFKEHPVTDCIKNEAQSTSIEKDKLIGIAKAMGLTEDDAATFADKIIEKFNASQTIDTDNLKNEINNLVSEDDNIQDSLKNKKNKDNEDLERAKKDKKDAEGAKTNFINELGDKYDPDLNKDNLQTRKDDAKKLRTQLEEQRGNVESIKKGNEERVKNAKGLIERIEEEDSYEDDMKTALKKERNTPTLKPGEEWNEKKLEAGYYDKDNKWVPRPKDLDDQSEYMEKLNKQNIFKPLPKEKELTYTYDSKTKKFTDKDGNEVTGEENIKKARETYIKEKVYNEKISQSNGTLEQRKADLLDKYTKLVDKDGKVNEDQYNKLSEEEKKEFEMVVSRYGEIVDLGDGKKLEGGNYGRLGKVSKNDNGDWGYQDEKTDDEKNDKEKEKKDGKKDDENTGGQGEDEDDTEDLEDTEYDNEEDIDDDESGEDDEDLEKEEIDGKKKIRHPGKIWKKRKNARTGKPTERYYRNGKKDGDTITQKEFQKKVSAFEKRKNKKSQGGTTDKNSFSGYIKGQLINETKSNYGKFRQYLKEILK